MRFYIYLDLNFELQYYAIRVNLHPRDKYQRECRLLSPRDNLRSQIPSRYDRLHYVSSHIARSSSVIPADSEDTTILIVQSRSALPQIQYSSFSLGAPLPVLQERGACLVLTAGLLRSTELLLWLSFSSSSVQRHRCAMLCFITV